MLAALGFAFMRSPAAELNLTPMRLDTNGQGHVVASVLVSNASPHTVFFQTLGQVWGPTLGLPTTTVMECRVEFSRRGHQVALAAFTRHDSNWLGRTRDYIQHFFRPEPITFYSLEIPE